MSTHSSSGEFQCLNAARGIGMMGSEASFRKILSTVATSLSADLPKVDQALQSGDVATANRLLHAFKGYMPIIASDDLMTQVAAVEFLSKTACAQEVQQAYAPLAPQLQRLLIEINHFLA